MIRGDRRKFVASDAAELQQRAPRHYIVLRRDDPLRHRVRQLCTENFTNQPNKLRVINVAMTMMRNNINEQVSSAEGQNQSHIELMPTAAVANSKKSVPRCEPGVLRTGEKYMFYFVNISRYIEVANWVIEAPSSLKLSDLSSNIDQSVCEKTYMFVVRVSEAYCLPEFLVSYQMEAPSKCCARGGGGWGGGGGWDGGGGGGFDGGGGGGCDGGGGGC